MAKLYNSYVLQISDFRKATVTRLLDKMEPNKQPWDFPMPNPWPHMFYSTGVTNELVRTLGLSDKTPPGLPGLKPSSNSFLPVAWIKRPATDFRQ